MFEKNDSPQKLEAVQAKKLTPLGTSTMAVVLVVVTMVIQLVAGVVMTVDHFTRNVMLVSSSGG